jgi:hypothetical protein
MPEIREVIAHFLIILFFWLYMSLNGLSLLLLGIWADATMAEQRKAVLKDSPAAQGHVIRLNDYLPFSRTLMRGNCNSQSAIWPPHLTNLSGLTLKRPSLFCRGVILDFGLAALKVRIFYLTKANS